MPYFNNLHLYLNIILVRNEIQFTPLYLVFRAAANKKVSPKCMSG